MDMAIKVTVLLPTYRRPQDLQRCLVALEKQTRSPDEILVVVRDTDQESWDMLETFKEKPLPLCCVPVTEPGQVVALNAGLEAAKGDVIAITDDDAAPRPHWLERIEAHFLANEQVGGVGGKDWLYHGGTDLEEGRSSIVGRVQWFGRVIGRHNLGFGAPRPVEVLKGANMSYRRTAIASLHFDTRLLGRGAQVHNDLAFSLAVRRAGWILIYDPEVEVDHYQAKRFDEDQRDQFNETAFFNAVHNETVALLGYLPPWRRIIFIVWALLIGTRKAFGWVQWCRFWPREKHLANQKWIASIKGRWRGWQTWRQMQYTTSPSSKPVIQG